jgi:hypothetical protein
MNWLDNSITSKPKKNPRTIQCPECSKKFRKTKDLEQHQLAKHQIPIKSSPTPKAKKKIPLKKKKKRKVKKRPIAPANLRKVGDILYEQRKYRDAIKVYDKYLKLWPQDVEMRNLLTKLKYAFPKRKKYKPVDNKALDEPKRIKRHTSEKKKDKKAHLHIFWWLGRQHTQHDLDVLEGYLRRCGAKFVSKDSVNINFRCFNQDGTSLHIQVELKNIGLLILTHVDVEVHKRVVHNHQSRNILLELYDFLKTKYGKLFLLPREERELLKLI